MSGTEDRRPSYFDETAPDTTGFVDESDRSSFHVASSLSSVAISSVAVSEPVSEESKALADVKRCDVVCSYLH